MRLTGRSLARTWIALAWLALPAHAETFPLPPAGAALIGRQDLIHANQADTLWDIAARLGHGYQALRHANPDLDPWLPGEGTPVRLPGEHLLPDTERVGLVINLPEMRLYFYPPDTPGVVWTVPVGICRADWRIPEMATRISAKYTDPVWHVPESIREEHAREGAPLPPRVPPGDDNPLGSHALRLGDTAYLIHASTKRYGLGERVSHGCLRLAPADMEALYRETPVGTPVRILNQPYKAGTLAGILYVEAHPPLAEDAGKFGKTDLVAAIIRATRGERYEVDWTRAFRTLDRAQGQPVAVGRRLGEAPLR